MSWPRYRGRPGLSVRETFESCCQLLSVELSEHTGTMMSEGTAELMGEEKVERRASRIEAVASEAAMRAARSQR